jgi:hypothetical protein
MPTIELHLMQTRGKSVVTISVNIALRLNP